MEALDFRMGDAKRLEKRLVKSCVSRLACQGAAALTRPQPLFVSQRQEPRGSHGGLSSRPRLPASCTFLFT